MKRSHTFILSLLLLSLTALPSYAETTDSKKSVSKPAPQMSAAEKKQLKERRERSDKARAAVNGSSWQVSYRSSDPKAKAQKDTFIFQDTVFKSEALIDRGYSPTNYTVSVAGDDPDAAIFETMQTSKDGVAFVRGEWKNDQMNGRITEQLEGGKKTLEYSFTTSARKAISPSSKEKEEGKAGDPSLGKGGALVSGESVAAFELGTTDEINS